MQLQEVEQTEVEVEGEGVAEVAVMKEGSKGVVSEEADWVMVEGSAGGMESQRNRKNPQDMSSIEGHRSHRTFLAYFPILVACSSIG